MKHIKGLIPSGDYHVTCRESFKYDEKARLVWTIDEGDWAWRNVVELYDPNRHYLYEMCSRLNYEPFEKDHPSFYEQFIGLRSLAKIDVHLKGDWKQNVILEHQLPTQPKQIDVLKDLSDSHFYKGKTRTLPI